MKDGSRKTLPERISSFIQAGEVGRLEILDMKFEVL